MSQEKTPINAGTIAPGPDTTRPSQDAVFEVLSNERRRYVIHAIRDQEEVDLGPLAEQVAAWENDTTVGDVTYSQRKRTYTALQQSHLPKMDDAGAVQFDKDRGIVEPTADLSEFDFYLEIVPQTGIPRSEMYLGLAAVSLAVSVLVALGTHPFGFLPDLLLASLPLVLFGAVSVAHLYFNHHNLKNKGTPPGQG